MPYKHRKPVQTPFTPHLRQPSEPSPEPVGLFEADFNRLPPEGQHLLVPRPPYPARLYSFGELLGLIQAMLKAILRPAGSYRPEG